MGWILCPSASAVVQKDCGDSPVQELCRKEEDHPPSLTVWCPTQWSLLCSSTGLGIIILLTEDEGISTFSINFPSHALLISHCSVSAGVAMGIFFFEGQLITCRAQAKPRDFPLTFQQMLPQQVELAQGQKHKEGMSDRTLCMRIGKKQHCYSENTHRTWVQRLITGHTLKWPRKYLQAPKWHGLTNALRAGLIQKCSEGKKMKMHWYVNLTSKQSCSQSHTKGIYPLFF